MPATPRSGTSRPATDFRGSSLSGPSPRGPAAAPRVGRGRTLQKVMSPPEWRRGALVTSYQLLQRRFGPSVSTVAAGLFLLTRPLADGIRLFATALRIPIVTRVPLP